MAQQQFDVENEFGFHPATDEVRAQYDDIRRAFKKLAQNIVDHCPDSRHKSLALTNLQQAQMWTIASVAINETPLVKGPDQRRD